MDGVGTLYKDTLSIEMTKTYFFKFEFRKKQLTSFLFYCYIHAHISESSQIKYP